MNILRDAIVRAARAATHATPSTPPTDLSWPSHISHVGSSALSQRIAAHEACIDTDTYSRWMTHIPNWLARATIATAKRLPLPTSIIVAATAQSNVLRVNPTPGDKLRTIRAMRSMHWRTAQQVISELDASLSSTLRANDVIAAAAALSALQVARNSSGLSPVRPNEALLNTLLTTVDEAITKVLTMAGLDASNEQLVARVSTIVAVQLEQDERRSTDAYHTQRLARAILRGTQLDENVAVDNTKDIDVLMHLQDGKLDLTPDNMLDEIPLGVSGYREDTGVRAQAERSAARVLAAEARRTTIIALVLRISLARRGWGDISRNLVRAATCLARSDIRAAHVLLRVLVLSSVPGAATAYLTFLGTHHGVHVPDHVAAEIRTLYTSFRPTKALATRSSTLLSAQRSAAEALVRAEALIVTTLATWPSTDGVAAVRAFKPEYWTAHFPFLGDVLGDKLSRTDAAHALKLYTLAAAFGVPAAQYKVGRVLLRQHTTAGIANLMQAASAGHIASADALAAVAARELPLFVDGIRVGTAPANRIAFEHYAQLRAYRRVLLARDDIAFRS